MIPVVGLVLSAAACPALAPVPGAPGQAEVAPVPNARSLKLNGEGRALYRQGRFEEARALYQQALAADPDHLGAALNAACALARQGRFTEAADEAAALVRRAYVPWARDVLEAADLGALQVRPEFARVRAAMDEGARAWAESLRGALFFVARARPAVRLPERGVLALMLNQEVWAWLPASGRYRQVTSEGGRVLALVPGDDGRHVAYVLAGRLVREPGQTPLLRGLSVRVLDTATMQAASAIPLPGDVTSVALRFPRTGLELEVQGAAVAAGRRYTARAGVLVPAASPASAREPVVLDGSGARGPARATVRGACAFVASQASPPEGARIVITSAGRRAGLATRGGAGLHGLPFPGAIPDR